MSHEDARPRPPHGAHGRPRTPRERRQAYKDSPYLPATVLVLIVAAAAGLFAGSYTYAMADPTPHRIPAALVAGPGDRATQVFAAGMEKALDTSLELRTYADPADARRALDEQRAFAVLRPAGGGVELDVAGASGSAVAQLLGEAGLKVGDATGVPVRVTDVKPLQKGDPRGLALFYISLAAVIMGFLGATQLSIHARGLDPAERVAFTAAYALLGGFAIAAIVDWLLGAVDLPFVQSWLILALTMFTTGMVFTMFNTLMGRWALIPTWGLMVIIGNPSSGGAVSWPLLPTVLGHIGRWLPPGASVSAQHTAVYYQGHQFVFPYLVLAAWALVSCAVFRVLRHRAPGGRARTPEHAGTPS
ncbi:ABC-2 family transporter protein [Streptomyces sp. ADI96-02]|uniref:ABC transporter permease n=1 Tax=Streptomyces sp. ADI96-02 TaxID=1522760 RepID=UPI000F554E3D|nr:ABC transporter permease [Streptomyces sp. ADI96-02]RPK55531.1 ABC-2 family transporter protein [Streptomyces sp. ADI96-02]